MISASTLTMALYNLLTDPLDVSGGAMYADAEYGIAEFSIGAADRLREATIERGTRINYDPSRALSGWVGIYPGKVSTSPRAMGGPQWREECELQVVVQTASYSTDGTNASDLLEGLIGAVVGVVNTRLTLGVSGCRVVGFEREYSYVLFDEDGSGDLFMPQAVIKLKVEVRSN